MQKCKVAVVIPALNEAETIGAVIDSLKKYSDLIVLVDDASTDETPHIARRHGALVISNPKNLGYDGSIGRGFALAASEDADIILTFDADGQHIASNIPRLVEPIAQGRADLVVGRRPYRARVSEHWFAWIARAKAGIDDPLCGLKAYRTEIYRKVGHFDKCRSIGTELMFRARKLGYRVLQQDIELNRRKDVPRFGRSLAANFKITKAILRTLPL